jgi:hypothetical protein
MWSCGRRRLKCSRCRDAESPGPIQEYPVRLISWRNPSRHKWLGLVHFPAGTHYGTWHRDPDLSEAERRRKGPVPGLS